MELVYSPGMLTDEDILSGGIIDVAILMWSTQLKWNSCTTERTILSSSTLWKLLTLLDIYVVTTLNKSLILYNYSRISHYNQLFIMVVIRFGYIQIVAQCFQIMYYAVAVKDHCHWKSRRSNLFLYPWGNDMLKMLVLALCNARTVKELT